MTRLHLLLGSTVSCAVSILDKSLCESDSRSGLSLSAHRTACCCVSGFRPAVPEHHQPLSGLSWEARPACSTPLLPPLGFQGYLRRHTAAACHGELWGGRLGRTWHRLGRRAPGPEASAPRPPCTATQVPRSRVPPLSRCFWLSGPWTSNLTPSRGLCSPGPLPRGVAVITVGFADLLPTWHSGAACPATAVPSRQKEQALRGQHHRKTNAGTAARRCTRTSWL